MRKKSIDGSRYLASHWVLIIKKPYLNITVNASYGLRVEMLVT